VLLADHRPRSRLKIRCHDAHPEASCEHIVVDPAIRSSGQAVATPVTREGLMAGGLRGGASLDTAEVARLSTDRSGGVLADTYRVPLDSTYLFDNSTYPLLPGPATQARGAEDFEPAPYHQITILRQADFDLQQRVIVTGEVRYPGPYALTRKHERVSDLVERAGGLLTTAYTDGARFYRSLDSAGRVGGDL
jgi:hypothetical protein